MSLATVPVALHSAIYDVGVEIEEGVSDVELNNINQRSSKLLRVSPFLGWNLSTVEIDHGVGFEP